MFGFSILNAVVEQCELLRPVSTMFLKLTRYEKWNSETLRYAFLAVFVNNQTVYYSLKIFNNNYF